jgi:hypothetical protein
MATANARISLLCPIMVVDIQVMSENGVLVKVLA